MTYICWVSSHLPHWLEVLFTEKFFHACIIHEDERKKMKITYIAWTIALAYAIAWTIALDRFEMKSVLLMQYQQTFSPQARK